MQYCDVVILACSIWTLDFFIIGVGFVVMYVGSGALLLLYLKHVIITSRLSVMLIMLSLPLNTSNMS